MNVIDIIKEELQGFMGEAEADTTHMQVIGKRIGDAFPDTDGVNQIANKVITYAKRFEAKGHIFSAVDEAEDYLFKNGYIVGKLVEQKNFPIPFLRKGKLGFDSGGATIIQTKGTARPMLTTSWYKLDDDAINKLDGVIISRDFDYDDAYVIFFEFPINETIKEEVENFLTEKNPSNYNENVLVDELTNIAKEENLPTPTKSIDSGSDALIFETNNPNVILRAELIDEGESADEMRESTLADYDIQETGGVSKIYNIGTYTIGGEEYLISWKERVNPNFEHVLWRKYGEEGTPTILYALHLYNLIYGASGQQRQEQLEILKNTEETSRLYNAVMQGLPVGDLAPGSNMGVNNEGYIVAFDV
jgi:hypothetical protein